MIKASQVCKEYIQFLQKYFWTPPKKQPIYCFSCKPFHKIVKLMMLMVFQSMSILHYWVCVFQHGETAIHMAASGGHTEVISFLQSKGADIAALDKVTSIYLLLRLFCCSKIIFLIIRYQFWKYKYYIIIVVYSVMYTIRLLWSSCSIALKYSHLCFYGKIEQNLQIQFSF